MKCPHCNVTVNLNLTSKDIKDSKHQVTHQISWGHCPACKDIIIFLEHIDYLPQVSGYETFWKPSIYHTDLIYPHSIKRSAAPEVPEKYSRDFIEASAVLSISPKASAAISRRILQNIIREEYNIRHKLLVDEIEDFIALKGVPTPLAKSVDAIRHIGNFAAHPTKDTNTGEIVDVERGEAEWLLETLEALFDFTFVQPKQLDERRQKLNAKLQNTGKPPMK